MNDWHAVQTRIRNEVNAWFPRQCEDPTVRFFLYYLESTPEHDGGILIASAPPVNPAYKLAQHPWGALRADLTAESNMLRLAEVCWKLPILSMQRTAA